MRILIVSMLYAPAVSPRAFRWHAIARHWAGQGHDVQVVCGGHPGRAEHETIDHVAVRRVTDLPRRFRPQVAPDLAAGSRKTWPGNGMRLGAAVWRKLYWPDYACLWYRPAHHAALACLREHACDALITVALPFTAHLVGLRLRPRVPVWLADSGDPFTFNGLSPVNNGALYGKLNYWAEERVLAACDTLTVTMAGAAAQYLDKFPRRAGKVRVIPPLAVVSSMPDSTAVQPNAKRRLVFLGTLFPRLREPGPLLSALRRLSQVDPALAAAIEVHFYGEHGAFRNELAAAAAQWPGLKVHGVVDQSAAAAVLAEADALINIGNATPYQLPSKLVEYAATGKPILNLVLDVADASADFLAAYPLATTLVATAGQLPDEPFRAFLRDRLSQRLGPNVVADYLAPYTSSRIADAYMAEITAARR